MWEELSKCIITHAALHYIGILLGTVHYLHPRLVNLTETLGFLSVKESTMLVNVNNTGTAYAIARARGS